MFQALFFGGIVVLMAGGIQYQVSRKQRTTFNDQTYIEDALDGGIEASDPPHSATQQWLNHCDNCSSVGNSTRYRVLTGKDDTAGEYFTMEVLMRAQAYGVIRGRFWHLRMPLRLAPTVTLCRMRKPKIVAVGPDGIHCASCRKTWF